MKKKGCNSFDDMDCSKPKSFEEFSCSSNNRGQRDLTLSALVSYYIDEHRDRMKRYFRYYNQHTLNDAIRIAALSVLPGGKRHGHQRRIIQPALDESARRLLGVQDKIKMCRDFEDLRGFVDRIIGDVWGIGTLTIYDISLRIGAKIGVYPKTVYLHRGVVDGAKALGLNYRQKSIPIKDIPEPISSNLEPYEIEDFLCICKGELRDIRHKNIHITACSL